MKLIDVQSMQEIDRIYVDSGLPELLPMEHAAKAVADVAMEILDDKNQVVVICGKGNNGGDGFGAARWLHDYGKQVAVFGVGSSSNEALTEYNLLQSSGVAVTGLRDLGDIDYLKMVVSRGDLVIDALLGTGFTGELQDNYALLTDIINQASCPVLSVDIPSGINGNTGHASKHAVQADYTVTLGLVKMGMLLYPGRKHVGKLYVASIGMPATVLQQDKSRYFLMDGTMAQDWLPRRQEDAHKGDCGKVAILAGSPGYTGAAALCARAAVKSGAGLVTLFSQQSSAEVLAVKLDEEMVRPLPEAEEGGPSLDSVITINDFACDVLALGPGLGRQKGTEKFVRDIVAQARVPLVIDADALNALSGHLDNLGRSSVPKVLTPHVGEFSRLTGLSVEEINANRLALVEKYAKKRNVILVLKGAPTLVALPDGAVYFVTSGSSSMATGGSGDVLTGIIAGLIAQGLTSERAAVLGCYWHGLAGKLATEGAPGLAAGEIADNLPGSRMKLNEEMLMNGVGNNAVHLVH